MGISQDYNTCCGACHEATVDTDCERCENYGYAWVETETEKEIKKCRKLCHDNPIKAHCEEDRCKNQKYVWDRHFEKCKQAGKCSQATGNCPYPTIKLVQKEEEDCWPSLKCNLAQDYKTCCGTCDEDKKTTPEEDKKVTTEEEKSNNRRR